MNPTKTPDSQKRASMKWTKKNKEALNLSLNPGTKDIWKGYAAKAGSSLVSFIETAVEEKAVKDGLHEAK